MKKKLLRDQRLLKLAKCKQAYCILIEIIVLYVTLLFIATDQEQLMIEAIENQLKQFKIRFVPNNEADEINSSVEP
ncbi:unnamed protein product [Rotaria sp. Silwood1]|nr:unnamed protein product [Rotaria sp. Silwood1]